MVRPRIYTTEAIVLRRKNTGEADRIITVMTPSLGKLRVLAKGVRKMASRRAGHLELFQTVRVTLHHGKMFDLITEASATTHGFSDVGLSQMTRAYYVAELVDQLLPETQEHEDVYLLLRETLLSIQQELNEAKLSQSVYLFALELLWLLGFLPRDKKLEPHAVEPFVESIIEKKMKTRKLLQMT